MPLTREQFLTSGAAIAPTIVQVPTPELGEGATICVRGMTAAERDEWHKIAYPKEGPSPNQHARLVSYMACDESGKRLFSASDIETIGQMPHIVIERIADAGWKLTFNRQEPDPKND